MLFLIKNIRKILGRQPTEKVKRVRTEGEHWDRNQHRGRLRGRLRSGGRGQKDVHIFPINEYAHLKVFWKDDPHGKGPGISCFVEGEQILRIDCFGKDLGHLHTGCFMPTPGEKRLYLPEPTRQAQIDRAIFEICRNLSYYQARVADPSSRKLAIETEKVHQASSLARQKMLSFLETVPILRDAEV